MRLEARPTGPSARERYRPPAGSNLRIGVSRAGRVNRDGGRWPAGTSADDRRCWVCGGPTAYRHCKILCGTCGFTRDCSDP